MTAATDFTVEAQRLLRDETQFKWYVVTLLVLVVYVYSVEVERRRWDVILAGLAFWLADWINPQPSATHPSAERHRRQPPRAPPLRKMSEFSRRGSPGDDPDRHERRQDEGIAGEHFPDSSLA